MPQNYEGIIRPSDPGQGRAEKRLSRTQAIVIGRDSSCQIIFDQNNPKNQGISGRHAEIRPLAMPALSGTPLWQICDLDSTNGTYVNQQRLQGCQTLRSGDRIRLDQDGPEFVFELHTSQGVYQTPPLGHRSKSSLRLSHVLPIISTSKDLLKKAYLIPGIATVLLVILLFSFGNSYETACPNLLINPFRLGTSCYSLILGTYFCCAAVFTTYLLCGKVKPWWVFLAAALMTICILMTPLSQPFFFVFRRILPGGIPETDFLSALVSNFFGAGLVEELLKALPIFAALYLGRWLSSPWREKCGIWEPLDGILLGVASGVGFVYIETLGQYVNRPLCSIMVREGLVENLNRCFQGIENGSLQIPPDFQLVGGFAGLMLVIPRILGAVSGHAAWSGYLGYFIGLAVLKPAKQWQLIGIGYLTAAIAHTLWNSVGQLTSNEQITAILQTLIGVMSYIFLVAAIIKGRQLSPTRAENFATRMIDPKHRL
jgi:RsiW-degrading membrane proteinase PrsW (M82 family)